MALTLATNTAAHLKAGIMGKQSSGKTKTAGKIAIGLVNLLKEKGIAYADKPVAMFDTETGSNYLIPDFDAAGIPFMVEKAKTLKALLETMDTAERDCSVLIIDSITHPYRELIAAYLRQKQRTFLQIDDWNYIKGDYGWAQFTTRFINSKLHIIMCGRAGDDLEQYVDENGKRQLEKIGTKMKGEAETGFEPSLLVLMEMIERNERVNGQRDRQFVRRATVVKDRWDVIDGQQFDDPNFVDFLPHISRLALGGEHVGVRDAGDSQSILRTEKRDWQPVQRRIVIDELDALLTLHGFGGTSGDAKKARVELVKKHFGTISKVEIEDVMALPALRRGYDSLHRELEGKPSKYAAEVGEPDDGKLIDSLPSHSGAPATAPSEPALTGTIAATPGVTIEEQIRKQLATLTTASEVSHFAMEVSKRDDLDPRTRIRLSDAVTARLKEVAQAAHTVEEKPEKPEKPAKPARGKARAQAADAAAAADEGEAGGVPEAGGDQEKEPEPAAAHAVSGSPIPMHFV